MSLTIFGTVSSDLRFRFFWFQITLAGIDKFNVMEISRYVWRNSG